MRRRKGWKTPSTGLLLWGSCFLGAADHWVQDPHSRELPRLWHEGARFPHCAAVPGARVASPLWTQRPSREGERAVCVVGGAESGPGPLVLVRSSVLSPTGVPSVPLAHPTALRCVSPMASLSDLVISSFSFPATSTRHLLRVAAAWCSACHQCAQKSALLILGLQGQVLTLSQAGEAGWPGRSLPGSQQFP